MGRILRERLKNATVKAINVKANSRKKITDFFDKEQNEKYMLPSSGSQGSEAMNDVSAVIESHEKKPMNEKIQNESMKLLPDKTINDHVPVYKQPHLKGRESFRLTPPQVKNKEKLYDFEVDENEAPRVNKKRRIMKTYQKKKRQCFNKVFSNQSKPPTVPDKAMTLRPNQNVCYANNSLIDNNNLVAKKLHKPHTIEEKTMPLKTNQNFSTKNNGMIDKENKNNVIENELPTEQIHGLKQINNPNTKCYKDTSTCNLIIKNSTPKRSNILRSNTSLNCHKDIHVSKKIDTEISMKASNKTLSSNNRLQNKLVNSGDVPSELTIKSHINNDKENEIIKAPRKDNSINHSSMNQTSHSRMHCSVASNSPLPEYSRLYEGIQIGPLYNSKMDNCNDVEMSYNFLEGVTASTPFKAASTPIKKNNDMVRLSGGEACNLIPRQLVIDSDDDSEEFFGFRTNDNHNDSFNSFHEKQCEPNKQIKQINGPVQKVSINEVISILKKNVLTDKKKINPANLLFNSSSMSPPSNNISSSFINSSGEITLNDNQKSIIEYIEKDNDLEQNKKHVQIIESDCSFTKPPRRSYTITPRKKYLIDYIEEENEEIEEAEVEKEKSKTKKRTQKKDQKNKRSKKEEKEVEKMAALLNSQFQEVDDFELVVE